MARVTSVREIYFDTERDNESSKRLLSTKEATSKETRFVLILGLLWNIFVAALIPAATLVWVYHPDFFGPWSGLEWQWSDQNTTEAQLHNWRSFNWHPVMMTLAFGFFSTIALPTYSLVPCKSKWAMRMTHIIFQLCSLSCALFGIWIAFNFKEHSTYPEMTSVHSWVGFGSVVFYTIHVIIALFFFVVIRLLCPGESKFIRKTVLHMHRFLGFCFYINVVLAMITGIYGRQWIYQTKQNTAVDLYGAEFLQANFLVLTILLGLFTVIYIVQYCSPRGDRY